MGMLILISDIYTVLLIHRYQRY